MSVMEIKRDIIDTFVEWKDSPHRKPVLLKGARQIGKSWVMEKFGREYFDYCAVFDFDQRPELKSAFMVSKEPQRILQELTMYSDVPIIPGRTLIVFDEIQECEEALNSLKYFYELSPEYHIIAAGSLLGVAVKKRRMAVPVGKVTMMRMFPITFKEFLRASDSQIFNYIEDLAEPQHLPEVVMNKLKTYYRRYMISGGMPEAVVAMLENRGMQAVDNVLQGILDLYELDFAK